MESKTQAAAGQVLQTWLPPLLADQLRLRAQHERRSVSAVIRNAIEDALDGDRQRKATRAERKPKR